MNFNTAAMYRPIFRAILKRVMAFQAEYEADVEAWYTTGDGAPSNWVTEVDADGEVYTYNAGGRGYAYPNCIHGSSLWTDYDNICGGCEDSLTAIQLAQQEARYTFTNFVKRMEWLDAAPAGGLPQSLRDDILTWAFGSLAK